MDTIFIALFALFSVGGVFKGLAKSAVSFAFFVLALMAALLLAGPSSDFFMEKNILKDEICGLSNSILTSMDSSFLEIVCTSQEEVLEVIENSETSESVKRVLERFAQNINFEGSFSVAELLSPVFYRLILVAVVIAINFILLLFVLKVLQPFVVRLIKVRFFLVTDKVLGFLFGALQSAVVYFLIVVAAIAVGEFFGIQFLINKVQQANVASIIYQNYGGRILAFLWGLIG